VDWAIVPIKTALENGADAQRPPQERRGAKKSLFNGRIGRGVSGKAALNGEAPPLTLKVVEMIKVGRKMDPEGFTPGGKLRRWLFYP